MVSAGAWDVQRKAERGGLGQPGKEKAQGRCYCCLQLPSGRCCTDGARLFPEMHRDRTRDEGQGIPAGTRENPARYRETNICHKHIQTLDRP